MKIARCAYRAAVSWGVVDVEADVVRPIVGAVAAWSATVLAGGSLTRLNFSGECWPLGKVRLLPPVERGSKILAAGANYGKHVREFGLGPPRAPFVFMKPYGALIGAQDDIIHSALTRELDHELELVVVIGARVVARASCIDAVLGYTVGNDVSARDLQKGPGGAIGMDFFSGKGLDRTTAVGPWIVTRDEFDGCPPDLRMSLRVNGEVRQHGRSSDMTYKVGELLAYADERSAVEPGDVLFTGTPGGVGQLTGRFLQVGDVVEAAIDGIGELRNVVRMSASQG